MHAQTFNVVNLAALVLSANTTVSILVAPTDEVGVKMPEKYRCPHKR